MVSVERLLSGAPLAGATSAQPSAADLGFADLSGACCIFFTSGSTGIPKCAGRRTRGVIRIAGNPEVGSAPSTVLSDPPRWPGIFLPWSCGRHC
jgi:hypothetical protein